MKKLKRLSPAEKKAIRDKIQHKGQVKLSKEFRERFSSDAPSFAPTVDGPGAFEEYAKHACENVGVAYERKEGKIYHHVGDFTGASSIQSVDGFVNVYHQLRNPRNYIYNYEEYLDALKRVGRIQSQLDSIDKHHVQENERRHKHEEKYNEWSVSPSGKSPPTYHIKLEPDSPPTNDLNFLRTYDLSTNKPNLKGYLGYIASVASDLRKLLDKKIPLFLEEDPDTPHAYVLGTPGSGKSEFLKLLIHTQISQPTYGALVVIEPAGDFVTQIAHWKEFVKNDRLVYIKPTLAEGVSPVINPFEIYGVHATDYSGKALNTKRVVGQELVQALTGIVGELSGPMTTVLKNCVMVLLDKEGATLEDLFDFMSKESNEELIEFAQTLTHHDRLPMYFSRKDSGFNLPSNKVTKDAVSRRIDGLLQTGPFKQVTCGKSTFHLEQAVEEKKIVLFDLAVGAIGFDESTALGKLIIAMLLSMVYRRSEQPEKDRIPVSLVIDECQNFVAKSMVSILNDTRKFKMTMTLSQQVSGQFMPTDLRDSVLMNTNMQVIGGTTRAGAKRNADMVGVEASNVETLKQGEFYTKPKRSLPAVKFKTRPELLKDNNSMTNEMWNLIEFEQIEKYYKGTTKKEDISFEEEPDITPQKW